MPAFSSPPRLLFLIALGLFALAGCEKDEVRSYTVTRPPPPTPVQAKVRLRAAIVENGNELWFFKLLGPVEDVKNHAEEFTAFIQSIQFTGKADKPVEWKVPAGWEKGPAAKDLARNPPRYATFHLGGNKAAELTVFKFGNKSPLLDNVARWCRLDLGLPPPENEAELGEYTTKFKLGDHEGVLVDMSGPGPRGGKTPPPRGDHGMRAPKPLPITYTVPEGWKETGPQVRDIVRLFTTFAIEDGTQKAAVEVSHMQIGNMQLALVTRWREQVGLSAITQEQLDKSPPEKIRIAGVASPFYDFTGPTQRSLVVSVKRGQQTWFFKMIGSPEVVGKNKSKFASFVQSVKFTGAADE